MSDIFEFPEGVPENTPYEVFLYELAENLREQLQDSGIVNLKVSFETVPDKNAVQVRLRWCSKFVSFDPEKQPAEIIISKAMWELGQKHGAYLLMPGTIRAGESIEVADTSGKLSLKEVLATGYVDRECVLKWMTPTEDPQEDDVITEA